MDMKGLSHIDTRGEVRMVDVSAKPIMSREAVARGEVRLQKDTLRLIQSQTIAKGNVLASARLAGILAAKKTGELIPLCHPLPLTHCEVNFEIPKTQDRIIISASAKIAAQVVHLIPIFGIGLVLGWARWKTGSLGLPILIHVLNNGCSLLILRFFEQSA